MKLFCFVLFTFIFAGRACFPAESNIAELNSIIEKLNNHFVELTSNSKTISFPEYTVNSQSSDLREISTFQETNALQQNNLQQDSVIIKLAENRLIIENLPKNDVLEIYNIMGARVYNRRVNAGTNEYLLSLPKGYYILKIGKLTKKIAIR